MKYRALQQIRGAFGAFEVGDEVPADAPGLDDLVAVRAVERLGLPAGAKVEKAVAVPPEPEPAAPEPEAEPEPKPEPKKKRGRPKKAKK